MNKEKEIKEIIVFANKDANDYKSWSNVPYFFIETLLSRGIIVHKVTLWTSGNLVVLFNKLVRFFLKETTYNFYRSGINFLIARYKIKNAVKKYQNADFSLFFTFNFSSVGLSKMPSVLFCDWTYEYNFEKNLKRKPDLFERTSIKRENNMIEKSDFVFSLFPGVAEYMQSRFVNENIFYIGNVINSIYKPNESVVLKKNKSSSLLFIGANHYKEGADCLIRSFELLKVKYEQLTLHIIGMESNEFEFLPPDVYCYGYLDKGVESDRNLFYSLLESAKIFINSTPNWGSFSASLEALYFYTPVIVSPYDEFVRTFGKDINIGIYCEINEPDYLANKIEQIFTLENYSVLCKNAHNSVEQYSWSKFVDKFIDKIKND